MLLENEFGSMIGTDDDERNDDDVIDSPLSNANDMIQWLKLNKPETVDEFDALKRMIIDCESVNEDQVGSYGIMGMYGQRLIFGPRNMLLVQGDDTVAYLLALLDGLRDELEWSEHIGEAWCAA